MQEHLQQLPVDSTASREARVFVEALAAMGEVLYERVDEHVAGAGVECEDVLRLGVSGNDGDIGYTADIEADAAELSVAVECVVGERNKRRALTAQCNVCWAKVADGGDAGEIRDDRAVANLESGSDF